MVMIVDELTDISIDDIIEVTEDPTHKARLELMNYIADMGFITVYKIQEHTAKTIKDTGEFDTDNPLHQFVNQVGEFTSFFMETIDDKINQIISKQLDEKD